MTADVALIIARDNIGDRLTEPFRIEPIKLQRVFGVGFHTDPYRTMDTERHTYLAELTRLDLDRVLGRHVSQLNPSASG